MLPEAFTYAQKQKAAQAFLRAVAHRDTKGVNSAARMPGFNPRAAAYVDCVDWSEPDYHASAMMIAVTNHDTRMMHKLHRLGATTALDCNMTDPLQVIAQDLESGSVKTLQTFLKLMPENAGSLRPSLALQHVLLHTLDVQQAEAKIKLLLKAGARRRYIGPDGVKTADLAALRMEKQSAFARCSGLLAISDKPKPEKKQPRYVALALGMFRR